MPLGRARPRGARGRTSRASARGCCAAGASPYVFLGPRGRPLTRQAVWKLVAPRGAAAGHRRGCRPTRSATRSRRTSSAAARTCASCRRSSATPTSRRRRSTRTSRRGGCGRCTGATIRGRERVRDTRIPGDGVPSALPARGVGEYTPVVRWPVGLGTPRRTPRLRRRPRRGVEYAADRLTVRLADVGIDEVLAAVGRATGADDPRRAARRAPGDGRLRTRCRSPPPSSGLLGPQNFTLRYGAGATSEGHRAPGRARGPSAGDPPPTSVLVARRSGPPRRPSSGCRCRFAQHRPLPVPGGWREALGAEHATFDRYSPSPPRTRTASSAPCPCSSRSAPSNAAAAPPRPRRVAARGEEAKPRRVRPGPAGNRDAGVSWLAHSTRCPGSRSTAQVLLDQVRSGAAVASPPGADGGILSAFLVVRPRRAGTPPMASGARRAGESDFMGSRGGEAVGRKTIVVSGARPTGRQHLGNYHGALKNWLRLQDEHALLLLRRRLARAHHRLRRARRRSPRTRSRWCSTGSPSASTRRAATIFQQSAVKEHAELYLLLGMLTPVAVARAHPDLQGAARAARTTATSRPTASSATRCCRRPTS